MLKILEDLSNAYGVSGMESEVRNKIIRYIKPYMSSIDVDRMGNLICHKKGTNPPVMLAAHMDEIGLVIKEIDEWGHIYFSLIGGLNEETLIGQEVHILTRKGKYHGVVSYSGMHVGQQAKKFPNYGQMYVDTGLNRKELSKRNITVGTYMVPERKFRHLGEKNVVSGKALDDRIGCTMLIELARRIKGNMEANVYFVFTVQEEMGLYGAKTSVYRIEPVWALSVDVNAASDFRKSDSGIGRGPSITVKDSQFIANQCLVDTMVECAKKLRIPYQLEVSDTGTTDALTISLSKGGIPAGVVGVAVRNIHSTVGVAHLRDIEQGIRLLEELVKRPPAKCIV